MFDSLDQQCIDTLRFLSVDMVQKAESGHPGLPLGAAPMAYVLWARHLRHDPADPQWPDRDRFVLSAGHVGVQTGEPRLRARRWHDPPARSRRHSRNRREPDLG